MRGFFLVTLNSVGLSSVDTRAQGGDSQLSPGPLCEWTDITSSLYIAVLLHSVVLFLQVCAINCTHTLLMLIYSAGVQVGAVVYRSK